MRLISRSCASSSLNSSRRHGAICACKTCCMRGPGLAPVELAASASDFGSLRAEALREGSPFGISDLPTNGLAAAWIGPGLGLDLPGRGLLENDRFDVPGLDGAGVGTVLCGFALGLDLGLAALVATGLDDGECLAGPAFGLPGLDAGGETSAFAAVFGLTPSRPGLLFGFCTLCLLKIDLPSTGADERSRSGSSQTRI